MDLTEKELRAAFDKSLQACMFFPKPAELREFAEMFRKDKNNQRIAAESLAVLERQAKPPGWTPVPPAELHELTEQIKRDAESKCMPDAREKAEMTAAERNGPTKVPTDPVTRRTWAKQQAIRMGYADPEEREPGCDDE